ncbi:MAG: hypothetical protein ACKV1O_17065 [Saprospiraceae bacterium]
MYKLTLKFLFLLSLTGLSGCVKELDLAYNPLDDPEFHFVTYNSVESTYLGPAYRDLRVNFSLRFDALTQDQRSKITSLRVYENGVARVNIADKEQRFFLRRDRETGSTLLWEVVLVSGDTEGPRLPINSYSYYVE